MNIQQMMKQAQKMQAEMTRRQEELAAKTYEAQSGGGMVTATINGKQELVSLAIDPEIVKQGDVAMIQDLVIAAVNEGIHKVQEEARNLMSGMMGSLGGI